MVLCVEGGPRAVGCLPGFCLLDVCSIPSSLLPQRDSWSIIRYRGCLRDKIPAKRRILALCVCARLEAKAWGPEGCQTRGISGPEASHATLVFPQASRYLVIKNTMSDCCTWPGCHPLRSSRHLRWCRCPLCVHRGPAPGIPRVPNSGDAQAPRVE